jgi:hypothetical protein
MRKPCPHSIEFGFSQSFVKSILYILEDWLVDCIPLETWASRRWSAAQRTSAARSCFPDSDRIPANPNR